MTFVIDQFFFYKQQNDQTTRTVEV